MTSNVIGMNSITIRGAAKIKSGKATTAFVHSPNIYQYMLNFTIWDADEPQSELGRIKYLQDQVNRFEARMIKAGYKIRDAAESASFASLLSYQAYYNKTQLTPAELEKFRQYRQGTRQFILNWSDFQGSPEQIKEKMYIKDAMMSLQAIEWHEKAQMARTSTERREANEKAKQYAEYKMNLFSDEQLRELTQAGKQLK